MPFDIDGENLEAFHVSEAIETMSCRCSECDWEGAGSDLGLQFQGRQAWLFVPLWQEPTQRRLNPQRLTG